MATEGKESDKIVPSFITLLIYIAAGLWVVWLTPNGPTLLAQWWWAVVLVALILLGLLALPTVRGWLVQTSALRRARVITFLVVPLLLVLISTVVILPAQYQAAAIRSVFFLVACLFPATLYYLFIATSKYSLLYEFITNLDRLGLLTYRRRFSPRSSGAESPWESESDRQLRILTYLQKFEAVYGALHPDSLKQILQATAPSRASSDPPWDHIASLRFTNTFTRGTPGPIVLATVLIALGWLITLAPWSVQQAPQWQTSLIPEQTPVHFAFLGAYFFSLQILFRRYVRWDLDASAYVAISLRIVLAVIGTWVAVQAVTVLFPQAGETQLSVLGFAIGVFPPVLWQLVQAVMTKATGATIVLPSLQSQMPISDLDGLTVWHEARLEEEDIENVPNMATADLVELMLNTRFSPERIVDWVDQAILYTQLGPEQGKDLATSPRHKLRSHGIRTASALIEACQKSEAHGDRAAFEAILPGEGRSPTRSLVDTISTNPNLGLIQAWRGLTAAPGQPLASPGGQVASSVPLAPTATSANPSPVANGRSPEQRGERTSQDGTQVTPDGAGTGDNGKGGTASDTVTATVVDTPPR